MIQKTLDEASDADLLTELARRKAIRACGRCDRCAGRQDGFARCKDTKRHTAKELDFSAVKYLTNSGLVPMCVSTMTLFVWRFNREGRSCVTAVVQAESEQAAIRLLVENDMYVPDGILEHYTLPVDQSTVVFYSESESITSRGEHNHG